MKKRPLDTQSEYGSGYATVLRQFLNHGARLATAKHNPIPGAAEEMAVALWMNGASDHLYDLECAAISDAEWERAEKLQQRALDIGHGFQGSSWSTWSEAEQLLDEAEALLAMLELPTANLSEAMAADHLLGLTPQVGQFPCALDWNELDEVTTVIAHTDRMLAEIEARLE